MPGPSHQIVVCGAFDASALQRLQTAGRVNQLDTADEARLRQAVRDCDALVVHSATHVTRELLEGAPRLRVIGRAGVGLENIDLHAARRRGISVVYTPDASTEAVADLTVGLMLAVVRHIAAGDAMVRAGRFTEARETCIGPELRDLTLGIIGLGRIGKAVARRCSHGFGMKILFNDIVEPGPLDFAATPADKDTIYRRADVVSLHVPLTEQTYRLIRDATLALFKPSALLINTARGAVVDSDALAAALGAGRIAGAALDVFDPEPPPPGHPLLSAPNTVFTPHVGARSPRALARMNDVVDDVIAVLAARPPRHEAQ